MVISDECVIVTAHTAPLVNSRTGCVTDDSPRVFSVQEQFQGFMRTDEE